MSAEKFLEELITLKRGEVPHMAGSVMFCVIEIGSRGEIYISLDSKMLAAMPDAFRRDLLDAFRQQLELVRLQ